MCSEVGNALALETCWQLWLAVFPLNVVDILERSGTRTKWLNEYRDELEAMLVYVERWQPPAMP